MKLRIVSKPGEGAGFRRQDTHIENAETGEIVEGVLAVHLHLTASSGNRAIVEVADFEAEIEEPEIEGDVRTAGAAPTDLDRLVALLDSFGLTRAKDNINVCTLHSNSYCLFTEEDGRQSVLVGEGDGWGGFYGKFNFDPQGKFVGHGVWE